jgi:hypothetical protein
MRLGETQGCRQSVKLFGQRTQRPNGRIRLVDDGIGQPSALCRFSTEVLQ